MDDNKRKHLEFIQAVISRMNNSSFLIKAWSITLISALFALAANDTNENFVLIPYMTIPLFWLLDGFFISMERRYRALYENTALKNEAKIDFSMDTSKYREFRNSWISGVFSRTLIIFYGSIIVLTLIIMFLIL